MPATLLVLALSGCDDDPPTRPLDGGGVDADAAPPNVSVDSSVDLRGDADASADGSSPPVFVKTLLPAPWTTSQIRKAPFPDPMSGLTEVLENSLGERRFSLASADDEGINENEADDDLQFVWQPANGNVELTALVSANRDCMSTDARWGLAFRDGDSSRSPYFLAGLTSGHDLKVQYREARGALSRSVGTVGRYRGALWMRVARHDRFFTAWFSTDGRTWEHRRTVELPGLPKDLRVGMFAASDTKTNLCGALFERVQMRDSSAPPPWHQREVGVDDDFGRVDVRDGVLAITGVGMNLDEMDADRCHYMWMPSERDVEIEATLIGLEPAPPDTMIHRDARVGVMIRRSTSEQAQTATVLRRPDGSTVFKVRTADNAKDFPVIGVPGPATSGPVRVRLTKQRDQVTAAYLDAAGNWRSFLAPGLEAPRLENATDQMTIGVAVTNGRMGTAVGLVRDVVVRAVTDAGPPPPITTPNDAGVDAAPDAP